MPWNLLPLLVSFSTWLVVPSGAMDTAGAGDWRVLLELKSRAQVGQGMCGSFSVVCWLLFLLFHAYVLIAFAFAFSLLFLFCCCLPHHLLPLALNTLQFRADKNSIDDQLWRRKHPGPFVSTQSSACMFKQSLFILILFHDDTISATSVIACFWWKSWSMAKWQVGQFCSVHLTCFAFSLSMLPKCMHAQ